MTVGIDISNLHSMSKGRGIGFYTENLISSLRKNTDIEVVVFESSTKRGVVDLLHYPFFDFFRPTLRISPNVPTVVTIHDVIPLLFQQHYPPGIKGRINFFRQKQSLKKVNAVITDSQSSTGDAIKVFRLPQSKVFTVHLAPSESFRKLSNTEVEKKVAKFNLPEKFLLYTGGVNWNKNLVLQTEAALKTGLDVVFAGGGFNNRDNLNHKELNDFKQFLVKFEKNPLIHILGFVSDEEMVALMNRASALLFASRYEGFGLPILEAQACGTPVITGKTSSMPEVAGGGAELADPDSIESIYKGINKTLTDPNYREQLIKKGYENLKRFSWKKTAIETAKVYENALG